ncbi:MAG: hypothetical protein JWM61_1003 [Micrococcaceae bacterium]|jgi:hypothetical protein|nr:hypothetical protein [Micrococcaceae bacterium]
MNTAEDAQASPTVNRSRSTAGAFLLTAFLLSGCATGGGDNWNSTAVGDDESVGRVDLRSVLLVTSGEEQPARVLGTLENDGDQPIDITISDSDEDTTLTIPAQGRVGLDTVETVLRTAGDAPGARTTLTASTSEGDVSLLVPVVDGTLDPYRPYLPE